MLLFRVSLLLSLAAFCAAGPLIANSIQLGVNAGKIANAAKLGNSIIAKAFGVSFTSGLYRDYILINQKLYVANTAVAIGAPAAGAVAGAAVGIVQEVSRKEEDMSTDSAYSQITDAALLSSIESDLSYMVEHSAESWSS